MRRNVERRQRILELRKQGMTRPQIANHLAISSSLVSMYLHSLLEDGSIKPISRQESDRRRKPRTATQKVDGREARQMRLDGKTYIEIANHFGVSLPTLNKVIGQSERITPLQQQLIKLRLQGMKFREIAIHVGKPESTVGVLLSRLIKKGLIPKTHK